MTRINTITVAFAGHRARKMPYDEKSKEHEKLERILKSEILNTMRNGAPEFYCGYQSGIDTLAALMEINLMEEIGTKANLNIIIPYKKMYNSFDDMQKINADWITDRANNVDVLHEEYTKGCYKERNKKMMQKANILIAVFIKDSKHSGTQMTISLAKKKGIEIRIINPVTYEIEVIPAKYPPKLLVD